MTYNAFSSLLILFVTHALLSEYGLVLFYKNMVYKDYDSPNKILDEILESFGTTALGILPECPKVKNVAYSKEILVLKWASSLVPET